VAATNYAAFGWLEPPISEEIPFGNGTKQCEQSGGEEKPFGGSPILRKLENSAVAHVCQHLVKYSDERRNYASIAQMSPPPVGSRTQSQPGSADAGVCAIPRNSKYRCSTSCKGFSRGIGKLGGGALGARHLPNCGHSEAFFNGNPNDPLSF
jgi:hypothetical protein